MPRAQVPGLGAEAGAPLVSHKGAESVVDVWGWGRAITTACASGAGVDKVAFTGSVATGSRIMSLCARDVRGVSLELGGKSPAIVFPDADLEKALEWCGAAATSSASPRA